MTLEALSSPIFVGALDEGLAKEWLDQ